MNKITKLRIRCLSSAAICIMGMLILHHNKSEQFVTTPIMAFHPDPDPSNLSLSCITTYTAATATAGTTISIPLNT